ncbi:MAG TPA: hypothetical protein VMT37_14775 [Solirubrobacterales bacterium]|nr:hypothetical protein [Solirubrobacterales bacterium]
MVDRRAMRKRGLLRSLGEDVAAARARADAATLRRLRLVNAVAATAFVVGGSLFAIGALLAQADVGGPLLPASVYLCGGVFFSSGGYVTVLQVVNGPRERPGGGFEAEPWRWWRFERQRLEWLSAAALFLGTLVFAVLLVDSFIANLTPSQADRLIWSPDMVGCALFLVSGHFAMVELTGTWLPRKWPRELGWDIVVLNQIGSVLFMVSAVASFVHSDGDLTSVAISNWGTFGGALCFAIAGVMQEFERPEPA